MGVRSERSSPGTTLGSGQVPCFFVTYHLIAYDATTQKRYAINIQTFPFCVCTAISNCDALVVIARPLAISLSS